MNLMMYWCITGLIYASWSYYKFKFHREDEEIKSRLTELEYCGLDSDTVIRIVLILNLLLGGILLPLEIINKLYKFFTGKEII